jgi:hypothetical protein
MKLTSEQREELDSLTQHEGWDVLLYALEQICESMGNDVLQYDLETNGPDGLCIRKSKYAGARKLYTEMLATVSKLNVKQLKKVNS